MSKDDSPALGDDGIYRPLPYIAICPPCRTSCEEDYHLSRFLQPPKGAKRIGIKFAIFRNGIVNIGDDDAYGVPLLFRKTLKWQSMVIHNHLVIPERAFDLKTAERYVMKLMSDARAARAKNT